MDIDAAIQRIQELALTVTGITQAPDDPPDKLGSFPMAVCWLSTANWVLGDATCLNLESGVITLEIHWPRKNLARTVDHSMDFYKSVPAAVLADHDLESNLDVVKGMAATQGLMDWGGVQTFGWHFELAIAGHEVIT